MPSSNFQQFNPTQSNQENDANYTSDILRSAGIQTNNIIPSVMLNKVLYQLSTFVTAFCNMLVNKGYSPNDANVSTLAALLATIQTSADGIASILSVAYSPTANFNAAASHGFDMVLTGNLTGPTLSGLSPGQTIVFVLKQDGVGGRSVVWPSQIGGNGGTIDSTAPAYAVFVQSFYVRIDGSIHPLTPLTQS